jgi:hypothetical protein
MVAAILGEELPHTGDFDGDGDLDANDIDMLSNAVRSANNDLLFDVNRDAAVNPLDRRTWVTKLRKTWFGDSTLDGEFSSSDLISVFQAGKYEDDVIGNSSWATGDWNGDGDFESGDLVMAFQDGGYEQGPRPAGAAVPEPMGFMLIILGLLFCRRCRDR